MGPGQHANLAFDLAHGAGIAAIDAVAGVENLAANNVLFQFLDGIANGARIRVFGQGVVGFTLGIRQHVGAGLLDGFCIGRAQVGLDGFGYLGLDRRVIFWRGQIPRLFRGHFGQLDNGLDDRLHLSMSKHHGAQHDFLGKLIGFRFHHHHGIRRAGHDHVQVALFQLVNARVQDIFAIDVTNPGRADWAHEGDTGNGQGGGCTHQGGNVGIILQIMAHGGADDLGFVAETIHEQGPDRPVNQARRKRLFFRGTAFTLEKAAWNFAGGICLFHIVDGEGEEIDALARFARGDGGAQHAGFVIGHHHGTIGLARDMSGFQDQLAPAPHQFLAMNIKHLRSLFLISHAFLPIHPAPSPVKTWLRLRSM